MISNEPSVKASVQPEEPLETNSLELVDEEAALEEHDHLEVDESRGGKRPVTVIFASIHGFETPPNATQDQIEETAIRKSAFDREVAEVVNNYGGVIDKIIRGFFMATFGTTVTTREDPVFAVLAAMEMCAIAERYEAEVHVGVNTGEAWVGQIRTERTIDTTVIGDAVNLAARLKTQAEKNQVVVSPSTYEATKDYFEYRLLRELPPGTLKGIDRPIRIYTPIAKGEKAAQVQVTRQNDAERLRQLEESIPEYLREKILQNASRLQGERKMVTLLYADVSGFTALSARYADRPEVIAEVMNRCHKRLGDIVYKYEGVVDKLVGDEIMAIFGAPIMHEDDPERAIWCAMEMMEEIERVSEEVQREYGVPPLSLHIGINTGRVSIGNLIPGTTRMDYTVIGEPTELAEVLEDISKSGEIVVGQRTYRLTRALFEFEEMPPVKVGDREVPVYKVIGRKEQAESKRGLAELGDVPMIGRDTEFQQGLRQLERVQNGESPIVTIIGEAGYGKSRLKRELRKVAQERGMLWIEGACFPNTVNQGYSVFLRALEEYFELRDDDRPEDRFYKIARRLEEVYADDPEARTDVLPYLANLLSAQLDGALREKIAYLDPEQLQRRTFIALRNLLLRLAATQPVVLALDDLHWLDNTSNDLIYFLLDQIREDPVLFMNIYRPERRDLCWKIGETAAEKYAQRYESIQIHPLPIEYARQLLDRLLPMDPTPEVEALKARLLEKAAGNPFYLEEFIRVLLDEQMIERRGDRWVLTRPVDDFQVPDSLEQMLSARIDKLDDNSKDVLQSASVIGREFEHDLLAETVEESEDLDECIGYLMDLDFIHQINDDPLEYIFGHIITYEISYNAIVVGRRRELHRRVGTSLERRHQGDLDRFLEILAYHFAESSDRKKAVHYLAAAGSKARRMFNNLDAVKLYERGLAFVEQGAEADPSDVLEILDGLGDVYSVLGRYEDSIQMFERAISLNEDPLLDAVFYRKLGGVYTRRGDWSVADDKLDAALELLDRLDPSPMVEVERGRILDMKGYLAFTRAEFPRADELCRSALELVEPHQALDVMCSVFKNLGNINLRLGRSDQAMEFYHQGIELAERIGDKMLQSQLYNNLSIAHRLRGEMDEAVQCIQKSIELKEQMAFADGLITSYSAMAGLLRMRGEWDRAEAMLEKALQMARDLGSKPRIAEVELSLAAFYAYRKNYQQAVEHNLRALEICRQIGHRQREMQALLNLCDAYLSLGNDFLDEAETYGQQAAELAEQLGIAEGIVSAIKNLGVVAWRRGERQEALDRFRTALRWAEETRQVSAQPEIYRNLGDVYLELGQQGAAREHLSKAAELYRQQGATAVAEQIEARIPPADSA
ncbi:MAG: hypothetical protein KatS3mg115_1260 [Candidatus Poribacteria bacterium]|nr:MAG: hypothetical protein KatS3mg115_1260 [Candidatus Poribacteria bacterium]